MNQYRTDLTKDHLENHLEIARRGTLSISFCTNSQLRWHGGNGGERCCVE